MKTIEQERGKILAERLELLNKFLLSNTDKTFGEFISQYGMTAEAFNNPLPEDYRFRDIESKTLEEKENLTEYTEELNALYFEQYLGHTEKVNAAADGEYEEAEGEWEEAKGKRKEIRKEKKEAKKKKKEDIKNARKEKKDKKKQLKSDLKAGKISKEEFKKGKKDARKEMRDKVGSGAGRAIGKLNKFNPAMVAVRNAYNSLLLLNFRNQAYNLGKIKDENGNAWKKILEIWDRFGGDPIALKNNIEKARGKKIFFEKLFGGRKVSASGLESDQAVADEPIAYYNQSGAEVAAWITAGAGALAAIGGVILSFKKSKGEKETPEENISDIPVQPDDPTKEIGDTDNLDTEDDGDEEKGDKSFFAEYKLPIFIGASIALVITISLVINAFLKTKK